MSRDLVAIYDYPNAKGQPRIRKRRWDPKDFDMQSWVVCGDGKGRWHRGIKDHRVAWAERALYRLPEVLNALRFGEPVYLCEGEKDADTITAELASSFTPGVGTSHWQGASDFHPRQAAWLARPSTSQLYVVCDVDAPGAWSGWLRYTELINAGVEPGRVAVIAPRRPHHDAHDAVSSVGSIGNVFRSVGLGSLESAARAYRTERVSAGSDWMRFPAPWVKGRST